jgi:hypothetical protein
METLFGVRNEPDMAFLQIRKLEIALLALALLLSLVAAVGVVAQDRDAEREVRRIERSVESLEKSYADLRLESEKRWAVIETELAVLKYLGGLVGASSTGLLIKAFFDLITARRAAQSKDG